MLQSFAIAAFFIFRLLFAVLIVQITVLVSMARNGMLDAEDGKRNVVAFGRDRVNLLFGKSHTNFAAIRRDLS